MELYVLICFLTSCGCINLYISVGTIIYLDMSKKGHIVYGLNGRTVQHDYKKKGEIIWAQKRVRFRPN